MITPGVCMRYMNLCQTHISSNSESFSRDAWIAFLGGFSGAAAAFLFDRLADLISKRRERYIKHKNAMVRMQYQLAKHQDRVGRLIFLLEGARDIISKGIYTHNRFPEINIIEDLELELGDIDLINEVANYWLSVERVNGSSDSLNRILDTLQQVALTGVQPAGENFTHLVEQITSFVDYLKKIYMGENIKLDAYLRILLKRDEETPSLQMFFTFYRIPKEKVYDAEIRKVQRTIKNEMAEREELDMERKKEEGL